MINPTIDYDYISKAVHRLFTGVTEEQKKSIIKIICMYETIKLKDQKGDKK